VIALKSCAENQEKSSKGGKRKFLGSGNFLDEFGVLFASKTFAALKKNRAGNSNRRKFNSLVFSYLF
jgi:hypothetical protein